MLVVDGNWESEIIVLCLVVKEDKMTISHLIEIFLKHNDTTKTIRIMGNQEMTERSVLDEKIPNAVLTISYTEKLPSWNHQWQNSYQCYPKNYSAGDNI